MMKGVNMDNFVTLTEEDLREFYEQLDDEGKRMFFLLLAVGKSAEYAMNYINCTERR